MQDRRDRAERLVRVARRGQRADVLAGALGAGGGQRRRGGPPAGRPLQPGNLRRADVQPEAGPAQLQRLLRPQRQVGRGELGAVRPAQPRGALGQAPGEHDEMLAGLQLLGEALDQQARAAAGVVGVVHDERASLLRERAEQGIHRAHGVLTGLRHGGRGFGKARVRRCGAQPGGEQLGGHAALVQHHLDGHRPPHVGQFRAKDGLAVPGSGLHHDDGGAPAHCAVSRGRRMWCGGRRPNSEPLSATRRRGCPAAAARVSKSAMRRKYPACDVHVTASTQSCRMSRPRLAEGKAGAAAQATSSYRCGRPGCPLLAPFPGLAGRRIDGRPGRRAAGHLGGV